MVNFNSSATEAEAVAKGIEDGGGTAFAFRASVASEIEVKALLQSAVDRWGRLDILVNNAGWSKRTPHHLLDDLTEEIWTAP